MTDQEVKECQDAAMQIWEIADKFGVSPKTVLNAIWRNEKRDREPKRIQYNGDNFNLNVGDIISAIEPEVNQTRRTYEVIAIFDHIYTCRAIEGGWTTSFRKQDFKREYDENAVKVSCRVRGAKEN